VVFTFQLSPEGKITKFDGFDQVAKNLANAINAAGDETKAAVLKMMQSIVTEDLTRASIVDLFDVLPNTPVKVGDSWKHTQSINAGPLGTYKGSLNLTYKGPDGKGAEKIDSKGEMSFDNPKKDKDGDALPFKVIKMEMTAKEWTGNMLFDAKAGRLISNEVKMQLGGTMVIEVAGMQVQAELETAETKTLRLTSKRPEAQK
jgi:Family of unknown function (DUF6263)